MPTFKTSGTYQPSPLSEADKALVTQHVEQQALYEDAECNVNVAKIAFMENKKQLIADFLHEKEAELNALSASVADLPETKNSATMGGYSLKLRGLRLRLESEESVEVHTFVEYCMSLYTDWGKSSPSLIEETNLDADIYSTSTVKQDFVVGLARLFRPLITALEQAYEPVRARLAEKNVLASHLALSVQAKTNQESNLITAYKEALKGYITQDITPMVNQRSPNSAEQKAAIAIRRMCDSMKAVLVVPKGEITYGREPVEQVFAQFSRDIDALLDQNKADMPLATILTAIKETTTHHQHNLKLVATDIRDELAQFRALKAIETQEAAPEVIPGDGLQQANILLEQLKRAIESVQQYLPEADESFSLVHQTCDEVLTVLNAEVVALEQTQINLKRLLDNMRAVDLYKSSRECEGLSEVASYVMYVLESAVRWLLECIHICSSTPEARITRENYFFKGPKKVVFEAFHTSLKDLSQIESDFQANQTLQQGG
ncbi:MAG: hypothetical protein P1U61_00320 [Legionellaceae bacterium]|nr:hypothetical protein [Legionellaceae bacterium]